jgi:hypothetical protein
MHSVRSPNFVTRFHGVDHFCPLLHIHFHAVQTIASHLCVHSLSRSRSFRFRPVSISASKSIRMNLTRTNLIRELTLQDQLR